MNFPPTGTVLMGIFGNFTRGICGLGGLRTVVSPPFSPSCPVLFPPDSDLAEVLSESFRRASESFRRASESIRRAFESFRRAFDGFRRAFDSFRRAFENFERASDFRGSGGLEVLSKVAAASRGRPLPGRPAPF